MSKPWCLAGLLHELECSFLTSLRWPIESESLPWVCEFLLANMCWVFTFLLIPTANAAVKSLFPHTEDWWRTCWLVCLHISLPQSLLPTAEYRPLPSRASVLASCCLHVNFELPAHRTHSSTFQWLSPPAASGTVLPGPSAYLPALYERPWARFFCLRFSPSKCPTPLSVNIHQLFNSNQSALLQQVALTCQRPRECSLSPGDTHLLSGASLCDPPMPAFVFSWTFLRYMPDEGLAHQTTECTRTWLGSKQLPCLGMQDCWKKKQNVWVRSLILFLKY